MKLPNSIAADLQDERGGIIEAGAAADKPCLVAHGAPALHGSLRTDSGREARLRLTE